MNQRVVEVILRAVDQASAAIRQVDTATADLRKTLGQATEAMRRSEEASEALRRNATSLSSAMEGLVGAMAALGASNLLGGLQAMAEEAHQAEVAMRVLESTARSMGVSYEDLRAKLDAVLAPLGVLPQEAASAAAQLLRAGFTVEQVAAAFQAGAASALAAGRTAAEGIENVAMALSTGQSIYLNYIGIAENIGPVLQEVASSMKGASEEAIRQAQNQAALNVILQATKQEVQSLPDLLGGYAGAQNELRQATTLLRQEIGEALLPVFTALARAATVVANALAGMSAEQKQAVAVAGLATGALGALAGAGMALRGVMAQLAPAITAVGNALRAAIISPVGIAVGAVLALGYAWVQSGNSADESRKRVALIGQALRGVAELAVGAAQAIVGLFSNLGRSLGGLVSALVQAFRGDLAGAWQTLQKTINLENWAQGFQKANENLVAGWKTLSATLRGEVAPATSDVGRWLNDIKRLWESVTQEAKAGGEEWQDASQDMQQAMEATGASAERAKGKVGELREEVSRLRDELIPLWRAGEREPEIGKPFERLATYIRTALTEINLGLREGTLTQEEAARRLRNVLEIYEPWVKELRQKGLISPEAAQQAYDALDGVKRRMEELRTSTDRVRHSWEELINLWRAGERDMSRPPERQTRWAEELQDELDVIQVSVQLDVMEPDEAIDRLRELIEAYSQALSEEFKRGAITVKDVEALNAALNKAKQLLAELVQARTPPLSAPGYADVGAMIASGLLKGAEGSWETFKAEMQRQAEEAARLAAEAARNQLQIISQVKEDAEKAGQIDISGGLKDLLQAPIAPILAAIQTGALDTAEGINALHEAAEDAERTLFTLYEAGEITAEEFLQGQRALKAYEDAIADLSRQAEQSAQIIAEANRNQLRIISEVVAEAEKAGQIDIPGGLRDLLQGPVASILTAVQVGALNATEGIQALQEAAKEARRTLIALYEAGEITAEEFQQGWQSLGLYEMAMADLREQVKATLGPMTDVAQKVQAFSLPQGWYDLPAILTIAQEELERISRIEDPAERLRELAKLKDDLEGILPVLLEFADSMRESGELSEEQVEKLKEKLGALPGEIGKAAKAAEQAKLDKTFQSWADAINVVSGAFSSFSRALSADTFGQALASIASGVGGLVSAFMPGGKVLGGLIGAAGSFIGQLVDTVAGWFDSGWGKVQQTIGQVAERYVLIGREAFERAAKRVPRGGLLGWLFGDKWEVDQSLLQTIQAVASALESGVLQGVRRAARAFLQGAADWAEQLRQGIREAIANAVIEAVIQGAIVKGALGKLLTQLTDAIASGDMNLARRITDDIMAAIPAVQAGLESVLAPFRGFLGDDSSVAGAGAGSNVITYQMPTVSFATFTAVDAFQDAVDMFGSYVYDLTTRGIRVEAVVVGRPSDWR